jgi:hypothetical protein
MLNVIMLNVIMLIVIMLNVIMLNVLIVNVITLNVIMLNVVAPWHMLYLIYDSATITTVKSFILYINIYTR